MKSILFSYKYLVAMALLIFAFFSCKKENAYIPPLKDFTDTTATVPLPPVPSDTAYPKGTALADLAYKNYMNAFLVDSGGLTYFRDKIGTSEKMFFWGQGIDIQSVEDYYRAKKDPATKKLIDNLLKTFMVQNAGTGGITDWTWDDFNDDILWGLLAFIRGYQITENKTYLTQSKIAFNLMYDRGWDTTLGGGIWWRMKPDNIGEKAKSGLSNNPAVVAGALIFKCTNDSSYLKKAINIYTWVRNTLYDPQTGGVRENISSLGVIAQDANVYNVGTFVRGANLLYEITKQQNYFDDATKTINYIVNQYPTLSANRLNGSWADEFARAMAEFLRVNPQYWSKYYPWIKNNAAAAWQARSDDFGISWNYWPNKTPSLSQNTWVPDPLTCCSALTMICIAPDAVPN